jgi:hypothetical protein
MPLVEKGVRGKGRQPLSPPQHPVAPERDQRSGFTHREILLFATTNRTEITQTPSPHAA